MPWMQKIKNSITATDVTEDNQSKNLIDFFYEVFLCAPGMGDN